MKNNQKGFIISLLIGIIALLLIGGGAYIYHSSKISSTPPEDISVLGNSTSTLNSDTDSNTVIDYRTGNSGAPAVQASATSSVAVQATATFNDAAVASAIDARYKKASNGFYGYVTPDGWNASIQKIYYGDINGDGSDDAVALTSSCNASCGSGFYIVLNQKDGTGKLVQNLVIPGDIQFEGAGKTYITNITIANGVISIAADNFCGTLQNDSCTPSGYLSPRILNFKLQGNTLVKLTVPDVSTVSSVNPVTNSTPVTFKDYANNIQFSYPSTWKVRILPSPNVVAETNAGYKIYNPNDSSEVIYSGSANDTCASIQNRNASLISCFQKNPANPWSLFYTTNTDESDMTVLNMIQMSVTAGQPYQG